MFLGSNEAMSEYWPRLSRRIAPNGAPIHALRKADGTPWMEGYSYAELPVDLQGKITLYARWGEWFSALCAVFVLGFATLRRRSFRKAA